MAINWQEAAGVLAEERAFAESGAGFLKTYAAADPAALLHGQRLYAAAKAASDGLIERFLVVLAEGRDPRQADDLKEAAERAFVTRLAFSRHVDQVLPDLSGTRSVLLDALAKPAADLVTALIEGGITIWQEFRSGDALKRQTISTRIEAQRWPAFVDVKPAA
jgi:hypothetical protein